MLIIAVLVVLFGGGRLGGLFGGSQETPQSYTNSGTNSYGTTQSGNDSNSYDTSSQSGSQQSGLGTGAESISNLLNMLMGSGSSPYDFTGSFESMTGSTQGQSAVSTGSGDTQADMSVASSAREKYTRILGNGKDVMTILVYMCGTDLESQNGMGTADLKEMAKATLSENVNLIVYTGGCRRWRNSVVSSSVNQIYQIRDGGLYCLEKDMGSAAMTTPSTLTSFIQYGQEHFPANRMALILWDHGGGSVSGYGYDEKNGRSSMTLAGIDNALKAAKVKFDFIGFDACLMATIENGLMLGQYADYMIASEETEPGVGWYYTGWLNEVSKNPGMATTAIGKKIVDDFVRVCAEQCRGQSTTLSTVDLAELSATVPGALKAFSEDMSAQIQEKDYQLVATARAGTREFAQSTKIDQIDLVHFAKNLGSTAGKQLADAIEGAVKYNRCGGGMTNANGLSIYFPYRRVAKVSQMVQTYEAIGMDETYSRCIQAFASMEVSGQVAAGTPISSYGTGSGSGSMIGGLMGSLLGGGIGTSSTVSYGSDGMADLIGSLFSGSAGGLDASGLADLFGARALSTETALETINENHLDAGALQWENGRITLSEDQWGMVESIVKNMFIDDGKGFIDLGCDSDFRIEGDALIAEDDGTWLSINGQPVAYYYLGTSEEGESYRIEGYVPCMLNGERARLMIVFDDEHPYGIIAGAQKDYGSDETDTQAKNMISIGAGDQVRFICDYYDNDENYQNTYYLGNPMTLGDEIEIANTPVGEGRRVTYCLTDLYQTQYWTPAL